MWTLTIRPKRGRVSSLSLSAGCGAIRAFDRACDEGAPGTYELKHASTVLARAVVQRDEYDVTWSKPRIFYALGVEGFGSEVERCAEYLDSKDPR